jgi:hypothetical protein
MPRQCLPVEVEEVRQEGTHEADEAASQTAQERGQGSGLLPTIRRIELIASLHFTDDIKASLYTWQVRSVYKPRNQVKPGLA